MKTIDFDRKVTSKVLRESLAKSYNTKISLERYTREQLEDFRNKLRTSVSQVETSGRFNETLENAEYQRNKLILDIINTHLEERSLAEAVDPKQAGVVQAAIDMQNKIKNMLEDIGAMMTKTMVALADDIKDTIGPDAAEQFGAVVTPALEAAMQHLQGTRAAVENGVGVLTGNAPATTIGAEPQPADDGESDFENDIESEPAEDDFAAADAAAGGPEVAGREKRESIMYRKPSITEANKLMYKLAR